MCGMMNSWCTLEVLQQPNENICFFECRQRRALCSDDGYAVVTAVAAAVAVAAAAATAFVDSDG